MTAAFSVRVTSRFERDYRKLLRAHADLNVQYARAISILAEGQFTEGWHFVNLEVKDLSSGIYMYRLDSESGNRVEKLLVVK